MENTYGWKKAVKWLAEKKGTPFPFQQQTWQAFLARKSGILNAPTGSGKTFALWLPCLIDQLNRSQEGSMVEKGLQVIWLTPLKALSKDIHRAMEESCRALDVPWQIGFRTGDTTQSEKQRQNKQMPHCLITTPESLHLLLAQKGYPAVFTHLKAVIVDEWHELLGTKRGVQVELALSRLRGLHAEKGTSFTTWGISATIGNLEQAAEVLLGNPLPHYALVKASVPKKLEVHTLIPPQVERFPWAGHMGTALIDLVLPVIAQSQTTLIFTNTRAMAEIWYQKLLEKAPDLAGLIAMHHGSLDRELRDWVEEALHQARLKVVVCTSSLDLGVDFRPVETVVQVGSPKGLARFLQRAGRSGHRPGATSRIFFLPVHALELVEAAALKEAADSHGQQRNDLLLESRLPLTLSFDVLVQYLVTLAVSEGFTEEATLAEIRSTYCFAGLTHAQWQWCLQFVTHGGESLNAYEEFEKVWRTETGHYHVVSRKIAMRHRMSVGTIVSEPIMKLKFKGGSYIGSVEEYFISKLKTGDVFWFAGRNLELVQVKEMTALVKLSAKKKGQIPRWMGGRLALSSELSALLRQKLESFPDATSPELLALTPLLELQQQWSAIPQANQLLMEQFKTDEGYHLLVYPFEGRMVHEIMAALLAYRMAQLTPISFSFAMNDYGFELLADQPIPLAHALELDLFTLENLEYDLAQSLNETELAKRRFREIATIAGLVFQGYPGKNKASRHLQASSQLIYEVYTQYEPENLLLKQAFDEVINLQLEQQRLEKALRKMGGQEWLLRQPAMPTPFAFPIMVDRLREQISSETLEDRIAKMQVSLELYAAQ